MSPKVDAVVVGAGPNGLVAATVLARAGLDVLLLEGAPTPGGGCRSGPLTLPGFVHDHCSAVHALGSISPAFAALDLGSAGVEWLRTDVALAHPLDGGRAGALVGGVDTTAARLGIDGGRYRRMFGPIVEHWDDIADGMLGPALRVPRHPVRLAQFGLRALAPAATLGARWFRTDEARALWAGSAAHAFLPLTAPFTSAFAVSLNATAHLAGWPVARGGSQRITDALLERFVAAGGRLECDRPVRRLGDLPASRLVLFDLAVDQVLAIAAERIRGVARRRLERFRRGPGVFKIDYALDGPVPWTNEDCRRAGALHVCGTAIEVAGAEATVAAGGHPERPFVLVAQQDRADPGRVPAGKAALWAYCHVPAGSTLDMTDAIEAQIERFAPGFRDLILHRHRTDTAGFAAYNASYVGGDITGGAHSGLQLLARPRLSPHPYRLPWKGAFLCSASTPPGGGVHGMAGWHAAHDALGTLQRVRPGS